MEQPKVMRGLHSLVIRDYETGVPISLIRSSDDFKLTPKVDKAALENSRGTIDEDIGATTWEMSFTGYEYIEDLMELQFGGNKTDLAAGPSIQFLKNVYGTSAYNPTTGVAGVTVETATDIKPGLYVGKVKTATTVSLYCLSDASFQDGTNKEYLSQDCLIADDLAIVTAGGETLVTGFGINLVGGSGTIAMTIGDTFEFYVHGANAGFKLDIGLANTEYGYASVMATPKKKGGLYNAILVHKFLLEPHELNVGKDYSKWEVKATCILDSVTGCPFSYLRS